MNNKNPEGFKLSEMAMRIFKDLYCFNSETISDAYRRVASEFGNKVEVDEAYELLKNNVWRPSTPIWFSAGNPAGKKIFSACWVTDLEDSMDSIYDTANIARKIFQSGAGIGIPIGKLRERDANIFEGKDINTIPNGKSSGPISFMSLFDAVGATTKSGGRARRAAIMCVMPVTHPDVMEFIECKSVDGVLSNMNISVAITDSFMQAFKDNIPFQLVSPSNGVVKEVNARALWDKIVDMSWKTADPGILFIDTINKYNPLKKLMKIECTNPCITGDTKIKTLDGIIDVKTLAEKMEYDKNGNYYVQSYEIERDQIEMDLVQWCGVTKKDAELIELKIEENNVIYTLKCTPDHQIYTSNRGYVEAQHLTKNDNIKCELYNDFL